MEKTISRENASLTSKRNSFQKLLLNYAAFMGKAVEKDNITPVQALKLTHSGIAFFVMLLGAGNIYLLLITFLWFVATLVDCKRSGLD